MSWLSALGLERDKGEYRGDMHSVCGYKAVSDRGEEIGSIEDYVLDGEGRLRYLVVDVGSWFTDKDVLVPVGIADIDDNREQVTLRGLTKDQVENMPDYDESRGITEGYETTVLQSYHPAEKKPKTTPQGQIDYDKYGTFKMPERLQLLEERLQVNKRPRKEGEVTVRKHVETHTETVDVPVAEERVVIERHAPTQGELPEGQQVAMGEDTVTVPLYKEEVEITKRPVVAEEVDIRKERDTQTRTVKETVSQEKLDVEDPQRLSRRGKGPRQ